MILGGGKAQLGLIKKAKKLGLYVIVVGIKGDYPGYKFADKCYNVDIFDKNSVLEIAQKEYINGISMVCSDFGLETLGYICDKLSLNGISEKSAKYSSNKLLMKKALEAKGVRTARFRVIHEDKDILEALNTLKFPIISKATDLQGSRGIFVCNTKEELLINYKKSIDASNLDYCIIEEFLVGEEFGVQAFVSHGDILFIIPHGDIVKRVNATNVPVGHYMPYKNEDRSFISQVEAEVSSAIKALEINNCAVNVDLILYNGHPYIIELTGRAGANGLPDLLSLHLGIDYYEMILANALNENCKLYNIYNNRKERTLFSLSKQIISNKEGILKSINYKASFNIAECDFFVKPGDIIRTFANSNDCIGKVLAYGEGMDDCLKTISKFEDTISLELLPFFRAHESAKIVNCKLGMNTSIWKEVYLNNVETKNNVSIGDGSRIENTILGDFVNIQRQNLIYNSKIERYTYTGKNFTCWNSKIGSFCSISWNVSIGGANHDYNKITTSAFLYSDIFDLKGNNTPAYNRFIDDCEIGNDVWIGCGATICRGIKIGNGAVIAANSVVTHDVNPYTIVAGVPARPLKKRFSQEIINLLLEMEWWNLPASVIKDHFSLFNTDPTLEDLQELKKLCLQYKEILK